MIADRLRQMLHREPFQPFRVCLSSGEKYAVTNADLVALMRAEAFIAFARPEGWTIVPYLHISGLETITNGAGRRRQRRSRG
jgi:hypothetical protein